MRFFKRLFGRAVGSAAFCMADDWLRRASGLAERLAKDGDALADLLARVESLSKRIEIDLENAKEVGRQYEQSVKALQSEIKILDECTVVPLEAANRRLREHWDAETRIEVMRNVAASPNREID